MTLDEAGFERFKTIKTKLDEASDALRVVVEQCAEETKAAQPLGDIRWTHACAEMQQEAQGLLEDTEKLSGSIGFDAVWVKS